MAYEFQEHESEIQSKLSNIITKQAQEASRPGSTAAEPNHSSTLIAPYFTERSSCR